MKKVIMPFLCLSLILFAACSTGIDASDKAVSVAKNAIEVVDAYLDGEMTYSETSDQLDTLKSEMDYVDEMEPGAEHKAEDFSIGAKILMLSTKVTSNSIYGDSESYEEVVDARNELAEDVGLGKR